MPAAYVTRDTGIRHWMRRPHNFIYSILLGLVAKGIWLPKMNTSSLSNAGGSQVDFQKMVKLLLN